jgi:hypothetical protein
LSRNIFHFVGAEFFPLATNTIPVRCGNLLTEDVMCDIYLFLMIENNSKYGLEQGRDD